MILSKFRFYIMFQGRHIFSTTFRLDSKPQSLSSYSDLVYPVRSVNLLRKCDSVNNRESTQNYRARNCFILARQHIHRLIPYKILTAKSKFISQLWKTKNSIFENYFEYLGLIDSSYFENFSNGDGRIRPIKIKYPLTCRSTYTKNRSRNGASFKVLKFKAKTLTVPFNHNNVNFGLKVQDLSIVINKEVNN